MKISLIEAKKQATPGKAFAEEMFIYLPDSEGEGCRTMLAVVGTKKIDAALFAHRWNTHDELVEALGELFKDWQTLVGQDLRENNADVAKIWKKSEAVLARAKTVEMP